MSSTVGLEHVAGDDHLHHLARAFGDAIAALLPPHLLDRKIGGERNAAVDLHALVGGFETPFRRRNIWRRRRPRAPLRLDRGGPRFGRRGAAPPAIRRTCRPASTAPPGARRAGCRKSNAVWHKRLASRCI